MNNIIDQSKKFALTSDWSESALDCHKEAFALTSPEKEKSKTLNRIARWNLFHCNFFTSFKTYRESLKLTPNDKCARNAIKRLEKSKVAKLDVDPECESDHSVIAETSKLLISTGFKDRAWSILDASVHRFNSPHQQNALAACIRHVDPKWAITMYDVSFQSDQNFVSSIGKTACLMDLKRFKEAELILKPILNNHPDDRYVLKTVARLEAGLGNKELASRLFAKADAIENKE